LLSPRLNLVPELENKLSRKELSNKFLEEEEGERDELALRLLAAVAADADAAA
jgi:hypothetical protein